MGNITQYPTGLLDLLKARERGQMPADLSSTVAGTVDLTPYYLNNGSSSITDQNAAPAAGGFNSTNAAGLLTVPPGEIWYVHEFSVGASLTALQGIDIAPAVRTPGPLNFQKGDWDRVVPAAITVAWAYCEAPFWAIAGTIFGALTGRVTAGPITIVGAVRATRLRA